MPFSENLIHVLQGQFQVSDQKQDVFSTVLGSCVAACLYDPVLKIGGMNHFLLPGSDPSERSNIKYGAHSMEQLINTMLRSGAQRSRIQAQLFGGGNVAGSSMRIGDQNASFAYHFMKDEGFHLTRWDLGGDTGRRLRFCPSTGASKIAPIDMTVPEIAQAKAAPKPPQQPTGSIELF